MAQHVLALEAPDTLQLCVLRLVDLSVYAATATPECPVLQVTVPGFSTAVTITGAQPGFMYNLTACDLELQTSGCGTTYDSLSDGIYILKWSVSPNEYVYVEYNHLRITKALLKIREILCDLDLARCQPTAKVKEQLRELNEIRMMLLAAKAKVEDCHTPKEGMIIYNFAYSLLKKFDCGRCTT